MPPRRQLRLLTTSSDEEDEPQPPPHPQPQPQPQPPEQQQEEPEEEYRDIELQRSTINFENVNLNSSNPTPNSSGPAPLDISDDDFIDVSDNLSSPSPSPPSPPLSGSSAPEHSSSTSAEVSDCPISGFLADLGLRLRREWLDSCIRGLESAVPEFSGMDTTAKGKLCFEQFLHSDMNFIGAGVLPADVHNMHLTELVGPFVLQVDEIVNISRPLKGRYQNASSGPKRCLKLSMTDGIQHVVGMEYRPIKDLEVLSPAGLKVVICNITIRHGILMLVPEVLEVLGGLVEELDAARQRLVTEVNKPARGKRIKSGVVPPLATRATLAAWPPTGVSVIGHATRSVSQDALPIQADIPGGASFNQRTEEGSTFPIERQNYEPNNSGASINQRTGEGSNIPVQRQNYESNNSGAYGASINRSSGEGSTFPIQRQNYEPNDSGASTNQRTGEEFTAQIQRQNYEPSNSPTAFSDDIEMVDEVQHLSILTGDRETPFNYLASLSARWVAMKNQTPSIQGKIKCFLTGVKGFQFKQRTTYELCVYVDDGSLISQIFIDHNFVQQRIGHSPEEVTATLVSSDTKRVNDMKETLKQFQIFLVNFEGTMVVRISEASPLPVAIEMKQGCSVSDAWGLLRRMKPSRSAKQPQRIHFEAIDLSP